ncbi:MAG: DUF6785 family protein [Planctomycetaceae bacterium]|nr:hypothetical protein [Planctomycetaceae bacterium]
MSVRSIILGLIFGAFIALFTYFNDWVLLQSNLAGNLVPTIVYGALLVGLIAVNPAMRAVRLRPLAGREWAVVVALGLAASAIPGYTMMHSFVDILVTPHELNRTQPNWKKHDLVRYAPPVMLADKGANADEYKHIVTEFTTGVDRADDWPAPDAVAWHAFSRTLAFWMPLAGLFIVGNFCMALVIHRQWSQREALAYPLAEVAAELTSGADPRAAPSVLRSGLFWLACGGVVAWLSVNALAMYTHSSFTIPLEVSLAGLVQRFPALQDVHRWYWLFNPRLVFLVVGLAYFIRSDASFSIGINHMLFAVVYASALAGGWASDTPYAGQLGFDTWNSLRFGAYIGVALMVLYVGKRFYGSLAIRALGVPRGERVTGGELWGLRGLVLCGAASAILLNQVAGLHWLVAVLAVVLIGLAMLVVTRVHVETGSFMIQPSWWPSGVLLGAMGFEALGAQGLVILCLLSAVLLYDPKIALMPMAAVAMRLGDRLDLRPARLSRWMIVAGLLSLAVAVPATIYMEYTVAAGRHYFWAQYQMPSFTFERLGALISRDAPPAAEAGTLSWGKIAAEAAFYKPALAGLALVTVCSWLRLRFPWWPLHPVVFIIWGTDTICQFAPSFLLGWAIKEVVTRVGGAGGYQRYKPVFIGLIAGEILAALIWMIVAWVYYALTSTAAPAFRVPSIYL